MLNGNVFLETNEMLGYYMLSNNRVRQRQQHPAKRKWWHSGACTEKYTEISCCSIRNITKGSHSSARQKWVSICSRWHSSFFVMARHGRVNFSDNNIAFTSSSINLRRPAPCHAYLVISLSCPAKERCEWWRHQWSLSNAWCGFWWISCHQNYTWKDMTFNVKLNRSA